MVRDFYVHVEDDKLSIQIPDWKIEATVEAMMTTDREGKVGAIGDRPEEIISQVRELIATSSIDELEQLTGEIVNRHWGREELVQLKELAVTDLENDTQQFWEWVQLDFKFVYPFRPTEFDPDLIFHFLRFVEARYCTEKYKKLGSIVLRGVFAPKYRLHVTIDQYDQVNSKLREKLEKKLYQDAMFLNAKKIFVNSKELQGRLGKVLSKLGSKS